MGSDSRLKRWPRKRKPPTRPEPSASRPMTSKSSARLRFASRERHSPKAANANSVGPSGSDQAGSGILNRTGCMKMGRAAEAQMGVVACRAVRLRVFVFSSVLAAGAATGCVPDERPGRSEPSASTRASSDSAAPAAEPRRASPGSSAKARALPSGPQIDQRFVDTFERAELGPDWNVTGSGWALKEGRLCVSDAHNHPAWLRRRLPPNARIEFEATSASPDGDLKVEAWGD